MRAAEPSVLKPQTQIHITDNRFEQLMQYFSTSKCFKVMYCWNFIFFTDVFKDKSLDHEMHMNFEDVSLF